MTAVTAAVREPREFWDSGAVAVAGRLKKEEGMMVSYHGWCYRMGFEMQRNIPCVIII